jgi:hypothetical protein
MVTPSYSSASPPLRNSLNGGCRFRVHAGQLTILAVRTPSTVHNKVVEKKKSVKSNKARKVIMVKEKVFSR